MFFAYLSSGWICTIFLDPWDNAPETQGGKEVIFSDGQTRHM